MNHQHQYQLLIQKALLRPRENNVYYEKHHIVPKSKGGTNQSSNLIWLTGREHFVAHMLLAHIYGGGMWQAAKMMKQSNKNQIRVYNSRLYEIAKREWTNYLKGKPRPKNVVEALDKARTGRKASEETKAKMSAVRKGRPRFGDPSKWKHSDEAKEKMRLAHIALNTGSRLPVMYGDENPMRRPENREKISVAKKAYWEKIRAKNQLGREVL